MCNCTDPYTVDQCNDWFNGVNASPQMPDCYDFGTNTAPGPGIEQAVDALVTGGSATAFEAILLISDGLPCCGGEVAERAAAGVAAADLAWDSSIHVWSVTYENGGGDFSYNASLVRGMGKAYATPTPEELPAILEEIAKSIPVVLAR